MEISDLEYELKNNLIFSEKENILDSYHLSKFIDNRVISRLYISYFDKLPGKYIVGFSDNLRPYYNIKTGKCTYVNPSYVSDDILQAHIIYEIDFDIDVRTLSINIIRGFKNKPMFSNGLMIAYDYDNIEIKNTRFIENIFNRYIRSPMIYSFKHPNDTVFIW